MTARWTSSFRASQGWPFERHRLLGGGDNLMKLAIMQPYFFPYLGYWQLIHAADRFVLYDDAHYIKGGWINRNRVLVNGRPTYLTVPLHKSSSHARICELNVQAAFPWRERLVRTVEIAYRRAARFSEVFTVIAGLIRNPENRLSEYLASGITELAALLGIDTDIVVSSRIYENTALKGQDRVLDICRREGASSYVNPRGGQELYDAEAFCRAGIGLEYLAMRPTPYQQRSRGFVPSLSIIDALMELGVEGARRYLDAYDLVRAGKAQPAFL